MSIARTGIRPLAPVLLVAVGQEAKRQLCFLTGVQDARPALEPHPPQPAPVGLVVVGQHRDVGAAAGVLDAPQPARALRLAVDRGVERLVVDDEDDRHEVGAVPSGLIVASRATSAEFIRRYAVSRSMCRSIAPTGRRRARGPARTRPPRAVRQPEQTTPMHCGGVALPLARFPPPSIDAGDRLDPVAPGSCWRCCP